MLRGLEGANAIGPASLASFLPRSPAGGGAAEPCKLRKKTVSNHCSCQFGCIEYHPQLEEYVVFCYLDCLTQYATVSEVIQFTDTMWLKSD